MGASRTSRSWDVVARESEDGQTEYVRVYPRLSEFASRLFGYPVTLVADATADEVQELTRSRLELPSTDT